MFILKHPHRMEAASLLFQWIINYTLIFVMYMYSHAILLKFIKIKLIK